MYARKFINEIESRFDEVDSTIKNGVGIVCMLSDGELFTEVEQSTIDEIATDYGAIVTFLSGTQVGLVMPEDAMGTTSLLHFITKLTSILTLSLEKEIECESMLLTLRIDALGFLKWLIHKQLSMTIEERFDTTLEETTLDELDLESVEAKDLYGVLSKDGVRESRDINFYQVEDEMDRWLGKAKLFSGNR